MKPKIGDIFVYAFIVLLIGISFFGIKNMTANKGKTIALIELDGRLVESVEMWGEGMEKNYKEFRFDTGGGGYNIIRISSEGIDVVDANCPDKLCVNSPKIKIAGQSIVCIPHKLVVRIVGENQGNDHVDETAF